MTYEKAKKIVKKYEGKQQCKKRIDDFMHMKSLAIMKLKQSDCSPIYTVIVDDMLKGMLNKDLSELHSDPQRSSKIWMSVANYKLVGHGFYKDVYFWAYDFDKSRYCVQDARIDKILVDLNQIDSFALLEDASELFD